MVQTIVSTASGPKITVDFLLGNPTWVPSKVLDKMANGWIAEALLRDGGPNNEGFVGYTEGDPLFLVEDVEDIPEFGEIPVAPGQIGTPSIAWSRRQGLGIRVSKDMRDRNKIGYVQTQMTQLANTMLRSEDRALRAALANPNIPTIAATEAWTDPTSRPRHDIAAAQEIVAAARPTGSTAGDESYNYEADTIVMPGTITPVLMDNDDFVKVYTDALVEESILYTGKLPGQIMGMTGLKSRSFLDDRVLVCERGSVGFYSDARPLQSTGMYPEGGGPNGGPTESWRSDTTKQRVIAIDQPTAACWITGIR